MKSGKEKQKYVLRPRDRLGISTEEHGAVPQWRMNRRQRAAGWEAGKEGRGQAMEGLLGLVKVAGLGPEPLI